MEIKILEDEKNKLIFQLVGADHTFCNALKKELTNVKGVVLATYAIEHPQIGIPKLFIETKGALTAKKALEDAIKSVKKHNKEFLTAFNKAIK